MLPRRLVAMLAVGSVPLLGCGTDDATDPAGGETDAAVQVVAGFYPLQYVAEEVGGDRVEVTNLTRPGADPHDLELAPRDVATLTEADLVVHLAGLQPAVDDAVTAQQAEALDVTEAADLVLRVEEEHGAEDEHGHEDEEHRADDGHDHGSDVPDPHFWLDPLRLATVGDAVAEQLAEVDPDGAQTYQENAAALRQELGALDEELTEGLADCQVDYLVTSHDAFGYLADRYGFTHVGISGLSPDEEPDPRALAEVADLVTEHGVQTVYSEVLVDPAVAETVAAEAGARTDVLDTLEGLTDASPGTDYPSVVRANLQVLREGQSCS